MNKKSGLYISLTCILIFAAALLSASCSGVFDTCESEASVRFAVGKSGNYTVKARTALPGIDLESYRYEIKGLMQDSDSEVVLAKGLKLSELNRRIKLARAKWIFYIYAYSYTTGSDGKETLSAEPIFTGESSEIDLYANNNATVKMSLNANTGGFGTIIIPVSYSAKGVKKVTCGLYTTPTGNELVEGKSVQEFTLENGITDNGDGSYTLTFTDDEVPSGKTIYATFILYDGNDVPVGRHTQAVYVAAGETSQPVVFLKNPDGTPKTDESGNYLVKEDDSTVEVDTNLYTTEVTAEKDKKVYAQVTVQDAEGNPKTLVYELKDEDGDGTYDTELPPGNYTLKIADADGSIDSATVIENTSVDIKTGNVVVLAKEKIVSIEVEKLADVKVDVQTDAQNAYKVTLNVQNSEKYQNLKWECFETALTVTPSSDAASAEVSWDSSTIPGKYGVVLNAKTADGTLYSTTVYITVAN